MRFGFHISIAGGFSKVVDRAKARRCETIQIFSRNPRAWVHTPLDLTDVGVFKDEVRKAEIDPVFVHLPYLVNLASKQSGTYGRSIGVMTEDLIRADTLAASYLIMHIGSRLGSAKEEALSLLVRGIDRVLGVVENGVILLLENTSGQGTQIGSRFEEIGAVIQGVENKKRVGVCLDTAHAFAAGYDISTKKGLDRTLRELDRFVGLERLFLIHLNDTRVPLGSGRDRHWHIGKGLIGVRGFRHVVNHPSLRHLPGIMETPRKEDREDLENMTAILSLAE
jgi:deoxyribonuclease-4